MTDVDRLARLEQTVARLEALAAPPGVNPLIPGDLPGYVAPGLIIESAWGNAVVDDLVRIRNEWPVGFGSGPFNVVGPGVFDIGPGWVIGPVAYPTVVTIHANVYVGFAGAPAGAILDVVRILDASVVATPGPVWAQANYWEGASLSFVYPVAPNVDGSFKTRAQINTAGGTWIASQGTYEVHRYGLP